jgi:hypothetical protein
MNDETNDAPEINRNEASDERKEKAAAEAYVRIRSGQHWLDWMFVAEGLGVGRRQAQRKAGTDDIQSPHYKRAFKEWMSTRPWAKDLDNPTRAHLFWCLEWRNDIDQWRETLAANERARLNHPTAMKRRYEAAHPEPQPVANPNTAPKKEPLVESLKRENEALWTKNKQLERRVNANSDGNLFDIGVSTAVEIANSIVEETIRLGKFTKASQINAALTKAIAAAKKRGSGSKAG